MTPFVKLQRLNDELQKLEFDTAIATKTIFTTANADTTARLDKQVGDVLVLARPELDATSLRTGSISTVFFVLDRDLGAKKTPENEDAQYSRLLEKANSAFSMIQTMTVSSCNLLTGLQIARYSVTPETSIFGGWVGWSVEIVFE